jgi:hypothetical protein
MNLLAAPKTGTTWTDASGNGNNGTLVTASTGTFTYTSNNGGGLITAGSGTSTPAGGSTAIATSYALTSPFTVEMWCKPNGQRTWSTLWGSDVYNSSSGWWTLWESTINMTTGAVPSGVGYNTGYSQTTPQHYVFTLTGLTYTFYLNGVAQTGSGYTAPTGGAGSAPLWFGSRHSNTWTSGGTTPTDALDATFYQMRVYNSALSSSQVTQNYSGTRGMLGV